MTGKKEFILNVQGYFRDEIRKQFPQAEAIYFVYKGEYLTADKACLLKNILYIGETEDLYKIFNEHENRKEFLESLKEDEMLFYTFAIVHLPLEERKRIVEALVYELNPLLNIQNNNSFSYPPTRVVVEGNRHAFIPASIEAPSY